MKTLLLAAGVAILTGGAGNATAEVLIQDFCGSTDGLRAQVPDTGAAVWNASGGQHAATWFFASASTGSRG